MIRIIIYVYFYIYTLPDKFGVKGQLKNNAFYLLLLSILLNIKIHILRHPLVPIIIVTLFIIAVIVQYKYNEYIEILSKKEYHIWNVSITLKYTVIIVYILFVLFSFISVFVH